VTKRTLPLDEEYFYDLMSFLVASSCELAHGEQDEEYYPSFRLMDGALRLAKAVIMSGRYEDEGWLKSFVEDAERGLYLMGVDDEAFEVFIDESTRSLAEEMKRRAVL